MLPLKFKSSRNTIGFLSHNQNDYIMGLTVIRRLKATWLMTHGIFI